MRLWRFLAQPEKAPPSGGVHAPAGSPVLPALFIKVPGSMFIIFPGTVVPTSADGGESCRAGGVQPSS